MKTIKFIFLFIVLILSKNAYSEMLSKETLQDKIKGGWAAKTIGCTYGGPVEFQYNGTMIQDYVPINWDKDRVK